MLHLILDALIDPSSDNSLLSKIQQPRILDKRQLGESILAPLLFANVFVLRCRKPQVYRVSEKMVTAYAQAEEWTREF